jgi:prepilin-type N-terminal cleavage/methylation domain-containing protein
LYLMARGFSLTELTVAVTVAALLLAIGLPRLEGLLDWAAADRAAREVTTALAVARAAAVMRGTRARVTIAADTLRIDRWEETDWQPYQRWPGPISRGVTLEVSNPEVVFGPTGMGWGASNTRIVLRRGSYTETITTSRLGRVKRW